MKKVLISLGVIVVLLIAAVLIVPGMIDWNTYKNQITAQVENLTGRKLTIEGDIGMTVLPSPALTASGIRFANAEWSKNPEMARLGSLEVRLVLGPLLGGEIQVQKVRVVDPVVHLEVSENGEQNWAFHQTAQTGNGTAIEENAAGQNSSSETAPAIQFDNVEVVNGTIIYEDLLSGVTERVEQLNASFVAGSLQGPFYSVGQLNIRDVPVSYEITVDGVFQGRTVPVSAQIRSEGSNSTIEISGNVVNLSEAPKFKGRIDASGDSLSALLYSTVKSTDLPGFINQNFDASADVEATPNQIAVSGLAFKLGSTTLEGDASATLGDTVSAETAMTVSHIDLDTVLSLAPYSPDTAVDTTGVEVQPNNTQSTDNSTREQPVPQIPDNISLSSSLVVDALTYRGEKAGPIRLNLDMANGELTVSQFSAQLPGASDVALFGFLNEQDGVLQFEGDSEISIGDTRGLARWLDIDISHVPGDRLRKVSLSATIRANPKQIQIANAKASFDRSNLSGGVTLAIRKRLAFGASVSLDRIDLDGYLPALSNTDSRKPTGESKSDPKTQAGSNDNNVEFGTDSPLSALKVLTTFDSNLRVQVGEIIHQGHSIKGLNLEGSLFQGDLSLESASVDDFAGASAAITGAITDLGGNPTFSDVKTQMGTGNVAPLANIFAIDLPHSPEQIGRVSIDAALNGSVLQPAMVGTFKAFGGALDVDGRLSSLLIKPMVDANVTLRHGDINGLLKRLGIDYQPTGKLGPLDFVSRVRGGLAGVSLTDLRIQQGALIARGSASVDLGSTKPDIVASLGTNDIDLDMLLPVDVADTSTTSQNSSGSSSARTSESSSGAPQWSTEPLALSALSSVNADIQLQSTSVKYNAITLKDLAASLSLVDGVLTIKDVKSNVFGGTLTVKGLLNSVSTPSIQTNLSFEGGSIATLLSKFSSQGSATGAVSFNGDFESSGRSVAALVNKLSGTGKFGAAGIDVKNAGGGSPLAGLTDLVQAIGQLGTGLGGKKTGGLADAGGSFTFTDGVAEISDFGLQSGFGDGTATGSVDLSDWTMNIVGELNLAPNLLTAVLAQTTGSRQTLSFSIQGSIDSPTVTLEGGSLVSDGGGDEGGDGRGEVSQGPGKLEEKVPGLGMLLQGVLGAGNTSQGSTQQQTPPPQSGTTNDAPETETQQQPSQQKITPEQLLDQLFKF